MHENVASCERERKVKVDDEEREVLVSVPQLIKFQDNYCVAPLTLYESHSPFESFVACLAHCFRSQLNDGDYLELFSALSRLLSSYNFGD